VGDGKFKQKASRQYWQWNTSVEAETHYRMGRSGEFRRLLISVRTRAEVSYLDGPTKITSIPGPSAPRSQYPNFCPIHKEARYQRSRLPIQDRHHFYFWWVFFFFKQLFHFNVSEALRLVPAYDVDTTGLMQKYVPPRVYFPPKSTPRPYELGTCFSGPILM